MSFAAPLLSVVARSVLLYAVACTILLTSGNVEAQQTDVSDQKYTLSISPPILQVLNMSAQMLENGGEVFFCLTGSTDGKDAHIDGYFVPQQTSYADRVDASPELCPKETVAWWHNHPRGTCALSAADINFAIRAKKIPFVVLHTDGHMYCWWARNQVETLTRSGKQAKPSIGLHALPGQLMINGSPK